MPLELTNLSGFGAGQQGGGYEIAQSLLGDGSSYLSRNFSLSNRRTWTFSFWVKQVNQGSGAKVPFSSYPASNNKCVLYMGGPGDTRWGIFNHNGVISQYTNSDFRDVTAWQHVVYVFDSTVPSFKLYINGVEHGDNTVGTALSLNQDSQINTASIHYLFAEAPGVSVCDWYMTEVHFLDGIAAVPTDFGEYSADTSQWVAIKYTGSYGSNGFYLNFSDSSNIGKDYSGNGNDWTVTGFTPADVYLDTPTDNFNIFNSAEDNHWETSRSNGNLTSTATGGTADSALGSFLLTSGKWYYECEFTTYNGGSGVGVTRREMDVLHQFNGGQRYRYNMNGTVENVTGGTGSSATYAAGDVIGCAFDLDAGTISWYKNGVAQLQNASLDDWTSESGWAALAGNGQGQTWTCDFGQKGYQYTPPAGFLPISTKNLPEPDVPHPREEFHGISWTGNGVNPRSLTGLMFQPDLVYLKNRDQNNWHGWMDSIRGPADMLHTNVPDAAIASSVHGHITSFDSEGFTVNQGTTGDNNVNNTGNDFIAHCWREGTVMDIVQYTGNGASNRQIAHNLGRVPGLIIIKSDTTGGREWIVGTEGMDTSPWTRYLVLDNMTAMQTSNAAWNNTAPTSTHFTVGSGNSVNGSGNGFMAYLFASIPGFFRCGHYVGNGNTTFGKYLHCGFRPRLIFIKNKNASNQWWRMYDTIRDGRNPVRLPLQPSEANAEDTGTSMDLKIDAQGFQLMNANTSVNYINWTYAWFAFAHYPTKYATAF